jgi:hypothetical protein
MIENTNFSYPRHSWLKDLRSLVKRCADERGEGSFVEGFEVDGAEGADVRGEQAVSVDEDELGGVGAGGDAHEALAWLIAIGSFAGPPALALRG